MSTTVYILAAVLLILLNAGCVVANLLMLPGNWLMVLTLCVFLLCVGSATGGPDWTTLLIVVALAAVGEALEMFVGSAKAAKKGASRRAMVLSLIASMAGSIAGSFLIPIPVVGAAIGAVAGAATGAFGGAWLGEAWKGTEVEQRNEIGTAAMQGRMLGMLGKLSVGAAIFVLQFVSLF